MSRYVHAIITSHYFPSIKIPTKGKNKELPVEILMQNAKSQLIVLDISQFKNRDLFLKIALSASFDCRDSDAKKRIEDFFGRYSSTTRLSTETVMRELNIVVLEKNEFQHQYVLLFLACWYHRTMRSAKNTFEEVMSFLTPQIPKSWTKLISERQKPSTMFIVFKVFWE